MIQALVVGAGPSGLTCAVELARRGVPCRLVDAAATLFPGSRGKGLQPRTLEVFDDLGVLDAVLAGGMRFPGFRLYAGRRVVWHRELEQMLGIEFPERPDVPHPRPWLIPQWRTDEILRDRFVELGGTIEQSTRLTALEQDPDGVSATLLGPDGVSRQERARYLVGTDGGRGSVRRLAGFDFEGETLEHERTLVGDVRVSGLDPDDPACHLFTRDGDVGERFSLWNLPDSPYFQLVAAIDPGGGPGWVTPPGVDGVAELFTARTGRTDLDFHDLRWISVYRVNVRMPRRFRTGRVLLAGDAAHVHSSASGQGLNASVQDSYNLGWKLAAVLDGARPELLDSYDAERVPVAVDLLAHTTALHRRGFSSTTRPAGEGPAIHQLDITYRHGPLARDTRPVVEPPAPGAGSGGEPGSGGGVAPLDGPRAGDRAPDAPLVVADGWPVRLFELLRGTEWTLLRFGGSPEEGAGAQLEVRRLPGGERLVARDVDGHARRAYRALGGELVLIRPDGHIGLVTHDPDDVPTYLTGIGLAATGAATSGADPTRTAGAAGVGKT